MYLRKNRISEIPFDSNRKMMTTVHNQNDRYISITKGAPDILINRCTKIYENGKIKTLSKEQKSKIKQQNVDMANEALRVIAVGYKEIDYLTKATLDLEENLIFVGLIGMIDPPREGVKDAVKTCK